MFAPSVEAKPGNQWRTPGHDYSQARSLPADLRPRRNLANYQRARLEDKITGCHDGVKFSLCETRLSTTRIKDQNQGTTRTHTLFQGILLQFSFNKSFTGHTRILAKTGRISSLLSLEQIEPSQRGEPVFLEDPRFNELFTVYSTDQIEARYLLTPGFMERLLELDELLGDTRRGKGSNLYAGFIGGNLLIAIRTTQNGLKRSLFENVIRSRVEDPKNCSFMPPSKLESGKYQPGLSRATSHDTPKHSMQLLPSRTIIHHFLPAGRLWLKPKQSLQMTVAFRVLFPIFQPAPR